MAESPKQVVIFWSWQADSDSSVNRSFIQACLEKAARNLSRQSMDVVAFAVERDTKGVGGSPSITDTILAKIRTADVFVWDATLVYRKPKPAPNPNVLFELGYALAALGDGRLVGVMNAKRVPNPSDLPFDLRHRRWPIRYHLRERGLLGMKWPSWGSKLSSRRARARDALVSDLENAIRAALLEPKRGAFQSDVNYVAARNLWGQLDSSWVRNWHEYRGNYPQYEDKETLSKFSAYWRFAELPENAYEHQGLRDAHEGLVQAIRRYTATVATNMVPSQAGADSYVIIAKANAWTKDTDELYERQTQAILDGIDGVWAAWERYVGVLRVDYPEAISEPSTANTGE